MTWLTVALSILMLALTTLALGASPRDAGAQKKACGSEIQAIEINKATLHYFECGEGEPIVFVHGTLGDLNVFRTQAQAFATRFRVISYSRRYHPPNAPPRAQDVYPLSAHVADLGALVKELKATPAHLVASSYGAYIALALAVDDPSCAQPGSRRAAPPPSPLARPWEKPRGSRGSDGSSSHHGRQLRAEICRRTATIPNGACGTACFDNAPQSVRTELVEKQAPALRAEMMTKTAALMPPLDCGDLGKLKLPTLLVTGDRSPAMFLLITAELERCLEGESQ